VVLEKALADAVGAHPRIALDRTAFAEYVAERMPEAATDDEIVATHLADLYLAFGCAKGDTGALEIFERRILDGVEPAVARIDRSTEFAKEIAHELRIKLLVAERDQPPRITRYLGRGPLRSWVQVAAIRAAYDRKRRDKNNVGSDDGLMDAPWCDDPELRALRDESRGLLKTALDEGMRALSVRDRNVLRLYLIEELPSEAIGRMYRVHRGTIARWIAGAHESLLSHVRRALLREKGLGPEQLDSLLRLAGSQLSVSLSILLR
jgi:RNA polymerase sigma-70 factor, ECF subfamily